MEKRKFRTLSSRVCNEVVINQQELVLQSSTGDHATFPHMLWPAVPGVDLLNWSKNNRDLIKNLVFQHGAVLFRGFDVRSQEYFQRFASVAGDPPMTYEANIYPRRTIDEGSMRAGTIYRPELKLKWHNEDNFDASFWPKKIMFYAHVPARSGGETPICDLRRMFEAIDPSIRRKFMEKGILYVRNYYPELGMYWEKEFGSTSRDDVERQCRQVGTEFEWVNDTRLQTRRLRPSVIRHPNTGEMIWFNLLQVWHPSGLEPGVLSAWNSTFAETEYPVNVYFGDGSLIENSVMQHIYEVYERLESAFPWQQGDILVLDNISVAHGRNPFEGPRQLYVAMDQFLSLDQIPVEDRFWPSLA